MRKPFCVFFLLLTHSVCAVHSYGADAFRDFDVHYQLGNEYNKRGIVDDAIREYKKAIEINDRAPKLYNNLGVAYGKKKLFDDEISSYKKAIELDTGYMDAYF